MLHMEDMQVVMIQVMETITVGAIIMAMTMDTVNTKHIAIYNQTQIIVIIILPVITIKTVITTNNINKNKNYMKIHFIVAWVMK